MSFGSVFLLLINLNIILYFYFLYFFQPIFCILRASSQVNQAVVNIKLEGLTEEVRKHNNFTVRVPILEEQVSSLNREIKELKHKIEVLENA